MRFLECFTLCELLSFSCLPDAASYLRMFRTLEHGNVLPSEMLNMLKTSFRTVRITDPSAVVFGRPVYEDGIQQLAGYKPGVEARSTRLCFVRVTSHRYYRDGTTAAIVLCRWTRKSTSPLIVTIITHTH